MNPVDVDVHVDIVVIGAGFAGLVTATELAGAGLDVIVVEARDRVGGKVESMLDEVGRRIDSGGQFVNDDMPNVLALLHTHGLALHTVDHGSDGHYLGGPTHPIADWQLVVRADDVYDELWDPAVGVEPTDSLADWLRSRGLDHDEMGAARSSLDGVMCCSIERLPVGHAVDLARRTPLTRQELQHVVPTTLHALAECLSAALPVAPVLGRAVNSVVVGSAGVTVMAADRVIAARHAVIATPPSAARRLSIDPPLPAATRAALSGFEPGEVFKFVIGYRVDFWHDRPGGPVTMWHQPSGLYVGDASLPGAPMLVGFLGGPAASDWQPLGAAGRRRALLDLLVEAYGPGAGEPVSFVERDWSPDAWGGGGYWNVLVDAAQLDAVDVLLGGAPNITFASTELAPTFPGYVEGAITAGRAAAQRVLAALPASATAG